MEKSKYTYILISSFSTYLSWKEARKEIFIRLKVMLNRTLEMKKSKWESQEIPSQHLFAAFCYISYRERKNARNELWLGKVRFFGNFANGFNSAKKNCSQRCSRGKDESDTPSWKMHPSCMKGGMSEGKNLKMSNILEHAANDNI